MLLSERNQSQLNNKRRGLIWHINVLYLFKTEDMDYKKKIQEDMDIDMIDKSLDEPINSDDEDYIMCKIREDYLADSTVTIYLIGEYSAENSFLQDQTYIKKRIASIFV